MTSRGTTNQVLQAIVRPPKQHARLEAFERWDILTAQSTLTMHSCNHEVRVQSLPTRVKTPLITITITHENPIAFRFQNDKKRMLE